MAVTNETKYVGATVLDHRGDKIGRVSDVLFDGPLSRPTWLVIKPGLLRAERYAPVRDSYRTPDHDIVVPYNRDHVAAAPKVSHDHIMSKHDRALVAQHFGLGS